MREAYYLRIQTNRLRDFGLHGASESTKNAFSANIVSLLQAGCFFGSLGAAPVGDKLGRRTALALGAVVFLAGSVAQTASAGNKALMFFGRVIGGIVRDTNLEEIFIFLLTGTQGVGFASMLVPLYTAECAPPEIRGRLVGIYEIGVQIGTCMGFWINYGVSRNMAPASSQWMTPFALQLIPAGLLLIGLAFMPDSPRWMAKVHGRDRAVDTLSRLRDLPPDHLAVQDEVTDILRQLDQESSNSLGNTRAAWKELMEPGIRNRVFLGVVINIFFQMTGSNAINYYSPRIFKSIGLKGSDTTLISTGIYGIVRLVTVFLAMYFVVDRSGRKIMLLSGSVVMVSSPALKPGLELMQSRQFQCGSLVHSSRSRRRRQTSGDHSVRPHTQQPYSSLSSRSVSALAGLGYRGFYARRSIPCACVVFALVFALLRTGYSILSLPGACPI